MNQSLPQEYLEILKSIEFQEGKNYFYLYNFGPCKFLPMQDGKTNSELIIKEKHLGGIYFPFAEMARAKGYLSYVFTEMDF